MSKFLIIFSIGGWGYSILEFLWRGYSHWTMFILGGICLYLLFILFTHTEHFPFTVRILLGSITITAAEFFTGCIVNIALGWNVWSYSNLPLNLLGQVCLIYSVFWAMLCIPIALLTKAVGKYI